MTTIPRYMPSWPLPSYVFIPGKNPHPKKVGGHMEGEKDPVAQPIDLNRPQDSDFLRYALDLYNYGHFWESHVYFEALWNAHGRKGPVADFLKALIKIGAAGVKHNIEQVSASTGHFLRAQDLLVDILREEGENFLGFNLSALISELGQMIKREASVLILAPEWN